MLNFLGITRHLSTTAGYAKRIGWLLREDVTQAPFPVTGVSFSGVVKTEEGELPISISYGEQENYLELIFPALPIGRWPYAIHAQDESGEDLRLFSGYIGAVDSVAPIEVSTVYDIPVMGVAIPIEAGKAIKAQWLSNTAASIAAQQAQDDAAGARTDADTAGKAATTATGAASTATERAREAEGYASAAYSSQVAAGNSATAASTSAADAARDAKSAHDAKTAVDELASSFSQTVSNGEQTIIAARDEAVTAIQTKQADSVLAVGRASQTAQQNIAGAQSTAVTTVETAKTEAVGAVQTERTEAVETIMPLVQRAETAKEAIDQAEGRIHTAETNAGASAANAAGSATAAQQALEAIPQVDAGGNMTLAGGLTAAGTINANGGVRVPLPSTSQEAMSWDAILEEQARRDWLLARSASYAAVPSWVSLLVRMQSISNYKYSTSNASLKEGVIENDFYDHVVRMTPASGISLLGVSTKPWKFAHLLGTYKDPAFATAAAWHITGADNASVMLGSTTHGYGCTTNTSAPCYSHPIHWCNYDHAGAHQDYRFPLLNAVNNYSGFDMAPAWQATLYGKSYLGSTASCLIRGTDYGRGNGDARYVWALVPSVTFLAVAMAPRKAADHASVENRWELFVDSQYVMPMTAHFCGGGHTAVLSATVKAHEVGSVQETGLRMAGMRVDTGSLPGSTKAREILGRVVMDGATVKPVPVVEASLLEVPAEGGEVTLTASSALSEALYVLNDTMNGHDPAAVWCTQSTEEIPTGGGQITLTLAPNTTGQPRQVWAFVGHHYAQAAVVEINQLA